MKSAPGIRAGGSAKAGKHWAAVEQTNRFCISGVTNFRLLQVFFVNLFLIIILIIISKQNVYFFSKQNNLFFLDKPCFYFVSAYSTFKYVKNWSALVGCAANQIRKGKSQDYGYILEHSRLS